MNAKLVLADLEDLAERMGVAVRYERLGDDEAEAHSGRCRLKGSDIILMDRRLGIPARIDILCREFRKMDLTGIFVKPYLRAMLEDPAPPRDVN